MLGLRWRLTAVGALLLALAAGTAIARAGGRTSALRYGVEIQAVFDGRGNPDLVANFVPDGSLATARWSICAPGVAACLPAHARDGQLRPGPEPAGTRFVARALYKRRSYESSLIWHGRVRPVSLPAATGPFAVGDVVRPVAARWVGGWRGDGDQLGIEACRLPNGTGCRMLGGGELGCPDASSSPRLGGWFTSWYLFAVDARMPRDDACAGTAYFANADLPLWPFGPTVVRSAPLGQIAGPPRPSLKFYERARRSGRMVVIGTARCRMRCSVWLQVDDRVQGVLRHLTFAGTHDLAVPDGLHRGKLDVLVHVDDSPGLRARTRLG
jgi:hypothetical protein